MTDIQDLVTATLRERAIDAPGDEDLAGSVRALRRRRQRRRIAIAAGGVAAAVAAAIVVPVALTSGPSASKPTPPVQHPAAHQGATQTIAFHGVEFDVPSSWAMNKLRCGTPVADTVVRDTGGNDACLIRRPAGVQSVEVDSQPDRWLNPHRNITRVVNDHGVLVLEGRLAPHSLAVMLPRVRVGMQIIVNTSTLERGIINSIRVVDVDDNGCVMHRPQLQPPVHHGLPLHAASLAPLVPSATTSIAMCKYTNDWLTASTTIQGAAVHRFARVVNHLPFGLGHAPASSYLPSICTDHNDDEWRSGYVLHLHGFGNYGSTLWAHVGFCGHLGITNGTAAGRLTPQLVLALIRPLHTGGGFPGRVIPDR